MNRYDRMIKELEEKGATSATCRGNSMLPILSNPSQCYYEKKKTYDIDDIVFCKVRGRYIDAHKIIAVRDAGMSYLIANNHGHQNGWTKTIYGKVVRALLSNGELKEFE